MITRRNLIGELRRTWRTLQQLNPAPLEVVITMDSCTGEVIAVSKAELPKARLFVNEISLESAASRDRMKRIARGDLVLGLGDDRYPEQLDCIARIVPKFEQRPNLPVLHFLSGRMSTPKRSRKRASTHGVAARLRVEQEFTSSVTRRYAGLYPSLLTSSHSGNRSS